jgi:hypothetical protein
MQSMRMSARRSKRLSTSSGADAPYLNIVRHLISDRASRLPRAGSDGGLIANTTEIASFHRSDMLLNCHKVVTCRVA